MRDRKLEQSISFIRDFINLWQDFGNFLNLPPEREIASGDEEKFMSMKSAIAQRCQALQEMLEGGFPMEGKIVDILSQSPGLAQIISQPMHIKKLQNDWHSTYIGLNKVLGSLEAKRGRLLHISRFSLVFKSFVHHPLTVLVFLIAIIMFFYALIARFLTPEKISQLKEKVPFLSEQSKTDTGQNK